VTLIDTLYPRRCPATGRICLRCPQLARLLVCLPAGTSGDREHLARSLARAIRPHSTPEGFTLIGRHFVLCRTPDVTEAALLLLPQPDPALPVTWCAGGPTGLLDLGLTAAVVRDAVDGEVAEWRERVADTTPIARAWWQYHDEFRRDPGAYPFAEAVAEFEAQPRVSAMVAAGDRYRSDMYGPGLEALTEGAEAYASYKSGVALYGEGLVDLTGQLLLPAPAPTLVEQTHEERRLYHDRARRYLTTLDPGVVLAAVLCHR
jgi:hypothetical protein